MVGIRVLRSWTRQAEGNPATLLNHRVTDVVVVMVVLVVMVIVLVVVALVLVVVVVVVVRSRSGGSSSCSCRGDCKRAYWRARQ